MTGLLLGIDIGTTATKAILLDPAQGIIAQAQAPANLHSPHAGWAEEDPDEWWKNIGLIVPACMDQSGRRPEDIAAVGVSGMVPTLILLDRDGQVLRPSIQQNDARATAEIIELQGLFNTNDILARTGSAITQQSIGPKLIWLRRHEPKVMANASLVHGSYDHIALRLTGVPSSERNWALESGLYDFREQVWIEEMLSACGITRSFLGEVHWPADIIGTVTASAAASTGLLAGTPVMAGCADHVASAFSAGLKEQGDLLVKLGGAGDILYVLDQLETDPRLYIDYHVIPGKYLLNGCMASSGSIIKWFCNQITGKDYEKLDAEASVLEPGSAGLILLPYFIGEKTPIHDPLARGLLFGLSLYHSQAHIHRAILEGISFGFLHHLKVLEAHDFAIKSLVVTNGGSKSTLWRQITADVLGYPLKFIAHHPGSSLGAAFVAGKGAGIFKEWSDIDRYIKISGITEPNMSNHARYQELFSIYRQLYENTKTLLPFLSPTGVE